VLTVENSTWLLIDRHSAIGHISETFDTFDSAISLDLAATRVMIGGDRRTVSIEPVEFAVRLNFVAKDSIEARMIQEWRGGQRQDSTNDEYRPRSVSLGRELSQQVIVNARDVLIYKRTRTF